MTVNATPQNAGNHAAKLRDRALACIFLKGDDDG